MAAKVSAAARARRHLYIVARTDAAEREGLEGAIARARLYVEAGADAIFPEALGDAEAFRRFAEAIEVPLLANMTEFGRTPLMTAAQLEALGYKMVIWPVSALRMAAKAHADLYADIRDAGGTHRLIGRMQTRAELYATIGYHEYEALDSSLVASAVPTGMPQHPAKG
jgi:methylisocitrate lyase